MTQYAKITDFASKDALLTGNPAKIVKGVEIDDEFNAIATADATSVKGPIGVTVDNTVVRWDGTTGRAVQGSGVTISDVDVLTAPTLSVTGNTTLGDASTDTVTANGYMGVGAASTAETQLTVTGANRTGVNQYGTYSYITGSSAATGSITGVYAQARTTAAAFTVAGLSGLRVGDATKGAGSSITNQTGIEVADQTQGTNNYGITSAVSSGTNKWNIYASGTAANLMAGGLIQTGYNVPATGTALVTGYSSGSSAALINAYNYTTPAWVDLKVGALNFTVSTNNTERLRIDSAGNILNVSIGGVGYGTGSGGTVTQATSRTTGVTLSKTNGAITLFTAAGSTTAASFTVTNTTVAATDTIILSVKSGTNKYLAFVTAVAAGSFEITFQTTGGTASDAPVINFAVLKAVTA